MPQIIHATYRDGVFIPEQPVAIAADSRVRLTVEAEIAESTPSKKSKAAAIAAFNESCDRLSVNSGGKRLTRDELHERR